MTLIEEMPRTNEEVVRAYFHCLDTEDWVSMRQLWRDDCRLRAVGARPRQGIDDTMGYFSKLFNPWVKHEDRPTRLVVSGDTVVAEVTFYGTTSAGRTVAFDAVDIFDLQGGQIHSFSNWYDIDYARKALSDGGE